MFGGANGQLTKCTKMGDMPLIAKSSTGELVAFSISNVRCVPAFAYTLLSVRQLWREQRIGARFEDKDYLKLNVDNVTVPYDASMSLHTVVAVSGAMLGKSPSPSPSSVSNAAPSPHTVHTSLVGFHKIGSTAHVAKMSSAHVG